MRKVLFLFLLFMSVSTWGSIVAHGQSAHDIHLEKKRYNYTNNKYQSHGSSNRVVYALLKKHILSDSIRIICYAPYALFVNHQFITCYQGELKISIDSLFVGRTQSAITLSVVQQMPIPTPVDIQLIQPESPSVYTFRNRVNHQFSTFLYTSSLLMLSVFTLLINRKKKKWRYNIYENKELSSADEGMNAPHIVTRTHLFYVVMGSIMWAILFRIVGMNLEVKGRGLTLLTYIDIPVVDVIVMAVALLVMIGLKWVWIYLLTWILGLYRWVFVQLYVVSKVWIYKGGCIMLLILLLRLLNFSYEEITTLFVPLLCIGSVISHVFIFLNMRKRKILPELHLFFYFCISEVIPLLILIKELFFF